MKKSLKNVVPVVVLFLVLAYFAPIVAGVLLVCGIYDVSRNKKLDASIVAQYFFGNGTFTWLLSPLNVLFDLLALPYLNKGIYKLQDLPPAYQAEINELIEAAHRENVVAKLEPRVADLPRAMFFYRWYGAKGESDFDIPAFQKPFKYIKTVGVSVFNRRESTSRHFGPLRATLRVLYNVNDTVDRTAYIHVGAVDHYWQDEKLFIFDDTLLHQSFNESDRARYCLFVDIVRPSLVPFLFSGIVSVFRYLLKGYNSIFYKNWKVVKA